MDYIAAPDVLVRLKQVNFVAVVGPTAVGKSTLIKEAALREPSLHYVLGTVSRDPRPGEQEGVDYHFKTRAEMEARIAEGGYVQVAPSVFGDLYASAPEDYGATGSSLYAVIAQAMPMFRALPFKTFRTIFVLPPDYDTWQIRVRQHGFEPDALQRRMREALTSLVFAAEDEALHFVINENLERAAEDFITLATGAPLSPRMQADQSRARKIVGELLEKLRASL